MGTLQDTHGLPSLPLCGSLFSVSIYYLRSSVTVLKLLLTQFNAWQEIVLPAVIKVKKDFTIRLFNQSP